MEQLLQAISSGLQIGLLYALAAMGLTIIWGLMEMINFSHGEFLMLGMFAAWFVHAQFGIDPLISMLPIALAMYGVGVGTYQVLMRHVQRGEIFTQIFATFGLLLFVQNSVVAVFTSDIRFVDATVLRNLSGVSFYLPGVRLDVSLLLAGVMALVVFLAIYLLIERTEFGVALQATSEDREAAMLMGVRPQHMFAVAWGMGAALVAVAGVILTNLFAIYPQIGLPIAILCYVIVALGGFGSILGTLAAALVVGVVESVSALYLPPAFKQAFIFSAYILIGLFRPQGLFGKF